MTKPAHALEEDNSGLSQRRKWVIGGAVAAVIVAIAVVVLVLSSGDEKKVQPTTTKKATTTTEPIVLVAPLTGVPLDNESIRTRPAVIVKVENDPLARPQAGLDKADIIYEERVEGGIVRFITVFQSQDGDPVGPVRSLRSTDPPVVAPIGGLFAYSGGIPPFVAKLRAVPGLLDVGADRESPALYPRRSGRPFAHSMFTSTTKLRQLTPHDFGAPQPQFVYLKPKEKFKSADMAPISHVDLVMGTRTSTAWDWDGPASLWRRVTNGTPHTVEGGPQLGMKNVIIQYVTYLPTGYRDRGNSVVDQAIVVGEGDAEVLVAGKRVKAHWKKTADTAVTVFTNPVDGSPIKLVPGTTWVMFAPAGTPTNFR